ncbi:sodium-coupled monocarboxylate transporter 2-like [Onthophagus taurus]|uniref:sodium-coupled monocarboxylate transporter 2-like n=1 Tax=Onthophagus taurus TaxID=166361 RepID=UPI0039BDD90F
MSENIQKFQFFDYTLFGLMLMLSVMIGIYFGCFGKKQSSANEYLFGGRTMNIFPIATSLVASHVSGITILAIPADIYKFGSNYVFQFLSVIINCVLVAYVFMPVFYNLKLTSAYQYLLMRFDGKIRLMASLLYAISVLLYLPIVIYAPSLALAQATPVNLHYVNPIICSICIFYTTIGGIKAVVWTDTLQFSAMIGAMLAVFYIGIKSVGGIGSVWEISAKGGRLDIDFDIDPTKRDTFWAVTIGWTVNWISHISVNQGTVQKFLSLPSMGDIRKATLTFCIGIVLCKFVSVCTGLVIYSKYYNCDPFLTKKITQNDQLLPFYVIDVASSIPGLSGLFIAGVFCAALSTLSAVMNSLSGVIYQDFISRFTPKDIKDKTVSNILKLLVVIIGVIGTLMVFVVEKLGGLLPLSISFSSITSGSLVGLFILGLFFPSANAKGALAGSITSLIFVSWIVIGSYYYKSIGLIKYIPKPTSADGCIITNSTTLTNTKTEFVQNDVFFLFKITYYYYSLIGVLTVIIVGMIVSWITKNEKEEVDENLITPWMRWAIVKKEKYKSIDVALRDVCDNTQ